VYRGQYCTTGNRSKSCSLSLSASFGGAFPLCNRHTSNLTSYTTHRQPSKNEDRSAIGEGLIPYLYLNCSLYNSLRTLLYAARCGVLHKVLAPCTVHGSWFDIEQYDFRMSFNVTWQGSRGDSKFKPKPFQKYSKLVSKLKRPVSTVHSVHSVREAPNTDKVRELRKEPLASHKNNITSVQEDFTLLSSNTVAVCCQYRVITVVLARKGK
jgi:hypothetical protein